MFANIDLNMISNMKIRQEKIADYQLKAQYGNYCFEYKSYSSGQYFMNNYVPILETVL